MHVDMLPDIKEETGMDSTCNEKGAAEDSEENNGEQARGK